MIIRKCQEDDYLSLIAFNKEVYPKRKQRFVEQLMDFRYKNRMSDFCNNFILTDGNQIYGQSLCSSLSYYFENQIKHGFWGFDFFVKKDKRRDGFGIDMMEAITSMGSEQWGTGVSDEALKIDLYLGYKLVGELKKYFRLQNPFCWIVSLFKNYSKAKYPQFISKFSCVDRNNVPSYTEIFNDGLVEFVRGTNFLTWRFFDVPHHYAFYKDNDSDDYFVVRVIKKMGFAILVIVDYRCDLSHPLSFTSIIDATRELAKKLNCSFILTSSTLRVSDDLLEKISFKVLGKNRVMISTMVKKEHLDKIKRREFALVTLADSDGEILW
jgi:hypothetical protein